MFTRTTHITPAYDGRAHPRNYGIAAMRLGFAVLGPKGAISFAMSTSWYLRQNQEASLTLFTKGYPFNACEELMQPKPWDISYHAYEPQYKDQSPHGSCHHLNGETCYCDGSTLYAREYLPGFLAGGSAWLFKKLEEEYLYRFENGPVPDLTPPIYEFPK